MLRQANADEDDIKLLIKLQNENELVPCSVKPLL